MWFSPSMTLDKRQRQKDMFADGRPYFNYELLAYELVQRGCLKSTSDMCFGYEFGEVPT
jgi:hypothetical protein